MGKYRTPGYLVLGLTVLLVGAWIPGAANNGPALVLYDDLIGAWESVRVRESYEISIGVTVLGKPSPMKRREEDRTQLIVPQHYGNLVGITGNVESSIFWYQDGEGVVRNVVVPDSTKNAIRIELQNTRNFKVRMVRN
jgi:hypothetical protein